MKPELFCDRLKKSIRQHGMTQASLAEKTGFAPSEINHWVSGRRQPNLENLAKLIKALNRVNIYWLIVGSKK